MDPFKVGPCPKCTGEDVDRVYIAAGYGKPESIKHSCDDCGFEWSTKTADADSEAE